MLDVNITCVNRIVLLPNQCECLIYKKTQCGELEMYSN